MSARKKRALGRGMADLVDGSFSSILEPAPPPQPAPEQKPICETAPSVTRTLDIVSVSSGKGGTGKSVVASNLGVLLAGTRRVMILDADLGLANIHILYNLMPRYNVSHVLSGQKLLEEILIPGPRGVNVIPGGSGIPELAGLTEPMLGALMKGIASLDGKTDLLLIDTPGGIDRHSLLFPHASDHVLVVTTEDITAMTDAYAVIKTMLAARPDASVALVVNMARSYADGLEIFHKVAHVTRKFLGRELALGGVIPFDDLVGRSVAERVPVSLSNPSGPASRALAAIAGRIDALPTRSSRASEPLASRLKEALSGRPAGAGTSDR